MRQSARIVHLLKALGLPAEPAEPAAAREAVKQSSGSITLNGERAALGLTYHHLNGNMTALRPSLSRTSISIVTIEKEALSLSVEVACDSETTTT